MSKETKLSALSSNGLVGLTFLEDHWSPRTVLAQITPDQYLVRCAVGGKAARIVGLGDMKSWKFFETYADAEEWLSDNSEGSEGFRDSSDDQSEMYPDF